MHSKDKQLNPSLFFIIREGKFIAWDYEKHQQFELEKEYFLRLLALSNGSPLEPCKIDSELEAAGFISLSLPNFNWGWDILSKIFHLGTRLRASEVKHEALDPIQFISNHVEIAKSSLDSSPSLITIKEGKIFHLPSPDLSKLESVNFLQVLNNRKTSRSFNGGSLDLDSLSTLLYAAFGNFHPESDEYSKYGFRQVGLRKTSPSAGGLHASEAYLLALKVDGLESGIYHYQSHKHVLTLIKKKDASLNLTKLLAGQYFAEDLSLGVFITSRFDKIWHKYPHSRAYRVALLDVGHISQTFLLIATALNLNTWLSGTFLDKEVKDLLGIQEETEQPLFFVGVGTGENSPLDPVAKKWKEIK